MVLLCLYYSIKARYHLIYIQVLFLYIVDTIIYKGQKLQSKRNFNNPLIYQIWLEKYKS